ncbi:MAG TPA: SRPBCC family protein [Acidimicrobiales bacterium]|nr:SRPBCC family protein [Acidimicrobiales bacterium]
MRWDLRAVGPEFYDTAPYRVRHSVVVRRPPGRLFDAIGRDPAGWGDWCPGFDHRGRWTSEGPPGEGSRRTVRMGGVSYEETILGWDPPHRFAFRVDRSAAPLAYALAEDYRIAEHPSGSTLEWTFAVDPRPVLKPMTRLFDPVLARMLRRMGANLERHLTP